MRKIMHVGFVAVALGAGLVGIVAGPAAPASASVPGITVETAQSPNDSYDKTVTVRCPSGKKVIDAGGYIENGGGKVTLDDIFPDPDLNFVNATGLETDSYGSNWRVHAYATCADSMPGLEWIKAQTATNSDSPKTLTVACSPGKTVLGAGDTITGGDGEVFVDEAVPNGGAGVAATQVSLIGVEGDDYSGKWDLDGFLICADPRPGQQVVSAVTSSAAGDKGTLVSCGTQIATGGTTELVGASGQVVIASDYSSSTTTATVRGEVNDGSTLGWSAKVYAFCADS